ncbi:MAG TPA: type 4a pilus biogenesis protein PilO [Longimicrobiales bacterium]
MALLPSDPVHQRKLMIGLIPLLALFGYWYFLHGKKKDEIAALETRLENLETKNAAARVRARQGGPELERRLAQYEEHIRRLEELVPQSEEVPELLHSISVEAQENRVDLAKLTPQTPVPGTYYTLQTHDMIVLGAYHDVGRFLTAVGSLPRIVTPVNLTLTPVAAEDGATHVQAEFRIKTYVIPEAKPAAQPAGGPNARA